MAEIFRALRGRSYRLFYIGFGLATTGTWLRRTAFAWMVYEITGSKAILGSVIAVSLLPLLVLYPLAGAVADRLDRLRLLIVSVVASAAASLLVALLLAVGRVEPWHLFALGFLGGVAMAFEVPTRHALLPRLVGNEELVGAVALNSAMMNLARIAGPAAAGFVMARFGLVACFVLSAVALLVHAALLLPLRLPPRTPGPPSSPWQALASGVHEASHNPRVRAVLLLLLAAVCFGISFETLLPAIARDTLSMDELEYGLFSALFGAGAIVGALLLAARGPRTRQRNLLFGGVWLFSASLAVLSLGTTTAVLGPALVVMGFGWVIFLSTGNALVQTSVDDAIRGRVMGLWALGFGAALPVGSFVAGHLAEATSPALTIRIFAICLVVVSIALYRRLPPRESLI